jgi:hypothetical protein
MTPEEILKAIQDEHNQETIFQNRLTASCEVMVNANRINKENLSTGTKIENMDIVARKFGFDSIKDVLVFRGRYVNHLPRVQASQDHQ